MAESRSLFVRDATGLVREIGFMLGVIIIMSNVVGLGWQKRAFQFSKYPIPTNEMWAGLPPIFWAFIIGGILVLITGYTVGLVTAAMPRAGGGYVTVSRVVHPFFGYIAGWMEFLSIGFSYGLIGTAVFEGLMIFYGIAGVPVTMNADQLAVGGILLVLIFGILALFGVRLYGYILQVMFWIPAIITIIFFAMWIVGTTNPAAMAKGIEVSMGAKPEEFVKFALQQGMLEHSADVSFMGAVHYALLGAFWAYIGYFAVTFLAGEVKEANVKVPTIVLSAAVLIVIVYLLASSLSSLAAMSVGHVTVDGKEFSFFQAYSYLSYHGAVDKSLLYQKFPEFKSAWSTGVASMVARGLGMDWLSWLIALGGVLWVANDIPPFLLTTSRILFAMAFDRMLPEAFAYVSERWHSPIWATVAVMVTGVIGAIAEASESGMPGFVSEAFSGKLLWAGVIGTDIFDALFLFFFALSALLLPFRRPDIYERAAVKLTKGAWALLGLISTVFSLYLLYAFFDASAADLAAPESGGGLLVLLIIGILLYAYYWWKNKSRGVDVRTIYTMIPPE